MAGKRISAEQVRVMAVFTGNPEEWLAATASSAEQEYPAAPSGTSCSRSCGSACWTGWSCMAGTATGFRPRQGRSRWSRSPESGEIRHGQRRFRSALHRRTEDKAYGIVGSVSHRAELHVQ